MPGQSAAVAPAPHQPLADATETGMLGIFQLKRLWSRNLALRQGRTPRADQHDRHLDYLVIHACGLGLEQTADFLGRAAPSFEAFERWVVETTGGVATERVARINAAVTGADYPDDIRRWLASVDASVPVLSADDLAFWREHGYVVLHDAVPAESRDAAAAALWHHLGASPDDPKS